MNIYDDILYQYELKNIAELSTTYKLLHYYSFRKYKRLCNNFNLTTINLNTTDLVQNYSSCKTYFLFYIGINIIANSIIKIARYLRYIELIEKHRLYYIGFGKLIRDIEIELVRPNTRNSRSDEYIGFFKNEFNRLTNNDSSDIKYKITSLTKHPKK